jgi:hypothetical protein
MIRTTRTAEKYFPLAVALAAFVLATPASAAAPVTYISSTGVDNATCSAAQPCATLSGALAATQVFGEITCLDSPALQQGLQTTQSVTIDCPGAMTGPNSLIVLNGQNQKVTIRHMTFNGQVSASIAIRLNNSGSVVLEDCAFENYVLGALDVVPQQGAPLSLVMANSRISNNGSGLQITPGFNGGGSALVKLDHVTIANNTGGGLKTDSTSGMAAVDITDSIIAGNAGNGINAVSGANTNIVNISRTIIANNGAAGVQANGNNSAAVLDTTMLDMNSSGAVSAINGGRVITHGTNSIIGLPGTGFNLNIPLQ